MAGPDADPAAQPVLGPDDLGIPLAEVATLVQFSSTFCAPCRSTRHVLERVAATAPGVTHVDLDVADHLALGERLAIDVTPTVLVLDAAGRVVRRATGVPTLAHVRAAIDQASGRRAG
ncbi:thioredoxin family protein [Cellulomonas alba]|uniref:Thioredoxin family protein n=1 Tax=Cellulomonas alba TaxID=3053467 RepID=A0ABT7SIZ5_9CELL|nr:thioredoxin family protein [Cellulomonas alba]MDM7856162.1 thioredoxin family protein [Cellulomonas alba]